MKLAADKGEEWREYASTVACEPLELLGIQERVVLKGEDWWMVSERIMNFEKFSSNSD